MWNTEYGGTYYDNARAHHCVIVCTSYPCLTISQLSIATPGGTWLSEIAGLLSRLHDNGKYVHGYKVVAAPQSKSPYSGFYRYILPNHLVDCIIRTKHRIDVACVIRTRAFYRSINYLCSILQTWAKSVCCREGIVVVFSVLNPPYART